MFRWVKCARRCQELQCLLPRGPAFPILWLLCAEEEEATNHTSKRRNCLLDKVKHSKRPESSVTPAREHECSHPTRFKASYFFLFRLFRKISRSDYLASSYMSIRSSAWNMEVWHLRIFRKHVKIIQVLRMTIVLDKSYRENQKVVFFFETCTIYEIMWKNTVEPNRSQITVVLIGCMRVAYCIAKATDTAS
jgi:hypothetical protein